MPDEKHCEQSASPEHGMDERRDVRHKVKRSGSTGGWKTMQGEESCREEFPGLVSDSWDSLEELSVATYGDALRSVKRLTTDRMLRTPLVGFQAMAAWVHPSCLQFSLVPGFLTGL